MFHYNKKASSACDRTRTALSVHSQVHKCKAQNVNVEHLMPRSYLSEVVVHSTSLSGSNYARERCLADWLSRARVGMSDTPPREWRSVPEESDTCVSARRLDGECALVVEA